MKDIRECSCWNCHQEDDVPCAVECRKTLKEIKKKYRDMQDRIILNAFGYK